MDSVEAGAGIEDVGLREGLRYLRSLVDDKYTPPEIEKMERDLWEKIRKAILAGEPPDPTVYQNVHIKLADSEKRLGEMDYMGRYYTTKSFGNEIESLSRDLPDDMFTIEYDWSDLVVFYKECEDIWEALYKLPSQPSSLRQGWRYSNVEAEAMLIFWGKYTKSVFTLNSPEGKEVLDLLNTWTAQYKLTSVMIPRADWSD